MSVAALTGSTEGLGSQGTWVQIFALVGSLLLALLFTLLSRIPNSRGVVASTAQWKKPSIATHGPGDMRWRSIDGYNRIDML